MRNDTQYPRATTPILKAIAFVMFILILSIIMSGCSTMGVKPWQRDLMAKRSMRPVTHPIVNSMETHIDYSKEASTGGQNASGGGCGCN